MKTHKTRRGLIPTYASTRALLIGLALPVLATSATATIMESGDLNIIDQAGNPSNGLRFLDMTYSDGMTLAAALANAQATYPDARVATPAENDNLFAAAGIVYDGALTAADGYTSGPRDEISSGMNYDAGALSAALGYTTPNFFSLWWTDPDLSQDVTSTRDAIFLGPSTATLEHINFQVGHPNVGWLLVSEASPVSDTGATLAMLGLAVGLLGMGSRVGLRKQAL